MRRLLVLIITFAIHTIHAAEATLEIPEEELKGGVTSTADGFRVDFQCGATIEKTPDGRAYDAVWFLVGATRHVGDTDLIGCTFMAYDSRGRLLASIGIEPRDDGDLKRPRLFDVTLAERAFATRCRLLFTYGARPMHNIVKQYVVPLRDHLPPKK
jgi:hypothetical protein